MASALLAYPMSVTSDVPARWRSADWFVNESVEILK